MTIVSRRRRPTQRRRNDGIHGMSSSCTKLYFTVFVASHKLPVASGVFLSELCLLIWNLSAKAVYDGHQSDFVPGLVLSRALLAFLWFLVLQTTLVLSSIWFRLVLSLLCIHSLLISLMNVINGCTISTVW